VDFGLSQFIGTAREPEFLLGSDGRGRPALIPRYNQIRQTGLELQAIVGDWLCKLEALRQDNPAEDFFAAIGGFEYSSVRRARDRRGYRCGSPSTAMTNATNAWLRPFRTTFSSVCA
jgi:hypothetical protein